MLRTTHPLIRGRTSTAWGPSRADDAPSMIQTVKETQAAKLSMLLYGICSRLAASLAYLFRWIGGWRFGAGSSDRLFPDFYTFMSWRRIFILQYPKNALELQSHLQINGLLMKLTFATKKEQRWRGPLKSPSFDSSLLRTPQIIKKRKAPGIYGSKLIIIVSSYYLMLMMLDNRVKLLYLIAHETFFGKQPWCCCNCLWTTSYREGE